LPEEPPVPTAGGSFSSCDKALSKSATNLEGRFARAVYLRGSMRAGFVCYRTNFVLAVYVCRRIICLRLRGLAGEIVISAFRKAFLSQFV